MRRYPEDYPLLVDMLASGVYDDIHDAIDDFVMELNDHGAKDADPSDLAAAFATGLESVLHALQTEAFGEFDYYLDRSEHGKQFGVIYRDIIRIKTACGKISRGR